MSTLEYQVISDHKERIKNMILFFIRKDKRLTKTKLMKLIWESDRRHFQETGVPISNLKYKALDYGPVPVEILDGLNGKKATEVEELISRDFYIEEEPTKTAKNVHKVKSKARLNMQWFSKRQERILNEVLTIYQGASTQLAVNATHEYGKEWATIYKNGEGKGKEIPYELMLETSDLDEDLKEDLKEIWEEYKFEMGLV